MHLEEWESHAFSCDFAVRFLEIQNLLHPIFNSQPRDTIEMFYVARYKSQIFLNGCCGNERVKMIDFHSRALQLPTNFTIFLQAIRNGVLFKEILDFIDIFNVFLLS